MFGKLTSSDYEKVLKRVIEIENTLQQRCNSLENRISALELENEAFRNKVLRKIQSPRGKKSDEIDYSALVPGQKVSFEGVNQDG